MANETNPFGDIQKIMDQFKVPGVDMPAIIEARRKDIEALVAANKAAFESMKALGAKQTEMFKEAMQGIQESSRAVGTGVGAGDPGKQAELVRTACATAIADTQDPAAMMRKSRWRTSRDAPTNSWPRSRS